MAAKKNNGDFNFDKPEAVESLIREMGLHCQANAPVGKRLARAAGIEPSQVIVARAPGSQHLIYNYDNQRLTANEMHVFDLLNNSAINRGEEGGAALLKNRREAAYVALYCSASAYLLRVFLASQLTKDANEGIISQEEKREVAAAFKALSNKKHLLDELDNNKSLFHSDNTEGDCNKIYEYLDQHLPSPKLASYAKEVFQAGLTESEAHNKLIKHLREVDIFDQLAAGRLTYKTPIFGNHPIAHFFRVLTNFTLTPRPSEETAQGGMDLAARVIAHEEMLKEQERLRTEYIQTKEAETAQRRALAKQEQALREATRALEEERAAVLRAKKEFAALQKFLAEPQPYPLDKEADTIFQLVSAFAQGSARDARKAGILASIVADESQQLDIRDGAVKELGMLLFSAHNLALATKAFDIDKSTVGDRKLVKPQGALDTLRQLHASSPQVRAAVERLLENDEGILLLATLTRDPKRASDYAYSLARWQQSLSRHNEAIDKYEALLTDFPEEEQTLLRQEKEYTDLLAARDKERAALNIDKTRDALAGEIMLVIEGLDKKKVASAEITPQPALTVAEEELQQILPPQHRSEFLVKAHPDNDRLVRIFSNDLKFKYVDLKRSASTSAVEKGLQSLRQECDLHRANTGLLHSMGNTNGEYKFAIGRDEDGRIIFAHPEYNIQALLETSEAAQLIELAHAEQSFQEHRSLQCNLLESARQVGITVEGVDENMHAKGAITFKHPAFEDVTLAPRGFLNASDTACLQELIGLAEQGKVLPEAARLSPDMQDKPEQNWAPKPNQTLLVFDASTLTQLAASRGMNGDSWLDIIKCTARLPNVRVIIPAVVADWEMQGKIPVYDKEGNTTGDFEQIDKLYERPGYAVHHIAQAMQQFMQSVSRAKLKEDGTISFSPGQYHNVIIMETPGDKALYDHIRDIMASPAEQRTERFQEEIHGKGYGEAGIDRIVQQLPFNNPFIVISDDLKYLKQAELTNNRGMPVGQLSTSGYIKDELRMREPVLRQMLGSEQPIYGMGYHISDFWARKRPEGRDFFLPHNKLGQSTKVTPTSLSDLIVIGMAEAETRGRNGNGGAPAPANTREAERFRRPPTQPRKRGINDEPSSPPGFTLY